MSILRINNNIKIFYTDYVLQNIKEFERKKAICFAGIGNPNNFFDLLKKNNVNVIEEICFSDHHNYSKKQLESLVKRSKLSITRNSIDSSFKSLSSNLFLSL